MNAPDPNFASGGAGPENTDPSSIKTPAINAVEPQASGVGAAKLAPARDDHPPIVDIPYAFARNHGIVVRGMTRQGSDGRIAIALRADADPRIAIAARRHLAAPLAVELVDAARFDQIVADHYAPDDAAETLGSIADASVIGPTATEVSIPDDPSLDGDDLPAQRLIHGLIAEAVRQGVSDVHIEPHESGLGVRMRVDGVLRETLHMPAQVAPTVVGRVKAMARLNVAERQIPQDGRTSLTLGHKMLDIHVSTLPNPMGERIVLRIRDCAKAGVDLAVPGLDGTVEGITREALAQPGGVILVTGPGGAGKTTTLYACLRQLTDGSRNILTIEDPVERTVDGVGQTPVNAKTGLTFASGLRAILRQDPDVVMVGEIDDRETAAISIQAALEGHLVLSTMRANDTLGAISRLRDMKIEPFLLASSLRAVIAQRLVRRLCPECHIPVQTDKRLAPQLGFDVGTITYRPVGCPACNHSGFAGRIGVFEALSVDDTIRRLINAGGDEAILARHAFLNAPTLGSSARAMVRKGLTTAEEAIRIMRGGTDEPE